MSKKEKNPSPAGEQEQAPQEAQQPQEVTEEYRQEETPETFTVTREQMEKMEALAGQLSSLHDQHLRLAAEYDNYRKRTTREKETIYQDAKLDTIAKFLEVYDNLERAASQTGDEDNVHKQGMVMIFNQLRNVLEKMGVTIDDPQGQPFDPARHNAVMHVDDENLGEGIVSQVFQKGFLLGERVIRCATVQVAN
ncbi:MAG TPA: nucleotide exchange factor GrpE [Candidatus Pelethomonas intestinigallinarum]|nr:nucleotide exchange factor GrpE [Candidatus Pelethomonas intestinigallinarum]